MQLENQPQDAFYVNGHRSFVLLVSFSIFRKVFQHLPCLLPESCFQPALQSSSFSQVSVVSPPDSLQTYPTSFYFSTFVRATYGRTTVAPRNLILPTLAHLIPPPPFPNINCLSSLSTEGCKPRRYLLEMKLAYGTCLYPQF